MCGIAGYYHYPGREQEVPLPVLQRMTRALARRGPDEEGYLQGDHWGLGHRRLNVIDLAGGKQPMTGRDGRVTVIFNGEIYNFQEIREKLEAKGRRFVTRSDTESLLQLYEEEGIGCLGELEGMFAVAILDRGSGKLFLANDPFGKKPLYYAARGEGVVFASEAKGILPYPDMPRRIDGFSLAQYLAFEYVPAPGTIFEGISKLKGGSCLEVGPGGTRLFHYQKRELRKIHGRSERDWIEGFLEDYELAVKRRLVSDVPLGVFLSGGLDSSSVLEMMRRMDPVRKIKTFTIGFDEASFDESRYARLVSRQFATEHIEERCTLKQMLSEHESILSTLDEPLADASYIPTFMLCRLVRRHVTVALAGDGGDELFCGYPTFVADRWAGKLDFLPRPVIGLIRRGVNRLPVSMDNLSLDFRMKQFFKGMEYGRWVRNQTWLGAFSQRELDVFLNPPLRRHTGHIYEIIPRTLGRSTGDSLWDLENFYLNFYLEGDILVKADRASMANSLEVRAPLLDDRLAARVRQIPSRLKLKGSTTKYLFKRSMQGRLPDPIINRPKKGFGIPIAHWIRRELRGEFESTLSPARIAREGLFDPRGVRLLTDNHLSGKRDNRKQLWTLYVFQKWKENWVDRPLEEALQPAKQVPAG